jgi:hypothetical protein
VTPALALCVVAKRGLQLTETCESGVAQRSSTKPMTTYKARAIETIPLGGLLIGLFDLIFAFTFYGLILGVPLLRIFQTVAGGVLGRPRAYAGGVPTFLLGIVLHFLVATCIATVYYFATRVLPVLLRHPVVSGLIYGVVAYFGMKYIVTPLSAIGARGTLPRLPILITELIGHALLVGVPVALVAYRSARSNNSHNMDNELNYSHPVL